MTASPSLMSAPTTFSMHELARAIRERIDTQLGKSISALAVHAESNRIVVRGRARSFYNWQQVNSICRRAIGRQPSFGLDCAMFVPDHHDAHS